MCSVLSGQVNGGQTAHVKFYLVIHLLIKMQINQLISALLHHHATSQGRVRSLLYLTFSFSHSVHFVHNSTR